MRTITDDAMEVHFGLTGPQTSLTVIIIPVLTRPVNCATFGDGQLK